MVKSNKFNGDKIFVKLLDGTETHVPCFGNILENGLFEIKRNDYMDLENDETSIWEFLPGDIVSYENRDNCLFAKELVSSTVENRRVYQFLFLLVRSFGKPTTEQIETFSEEINFLKKSEKIRQKRHPIVQNWIDQNNGSKPN